VKQRGAQVTPTRDRVRRVLDSTGMEVDLDGDKERDDGRVASRQIGIELLTLQ